MSVLLERAITARLFMAVCKVLLKGLVGVVFIGLVALAVYLWVLRW